MNQSSLSFNATDLLVGFAVAISIVLGWACLRATAHSGQRKALWFASYWLLLCYSVELVVAAIVCNGQGVWAGLGPAGLLGTVLLGCGGYRLREAAEEVEARRIAARDCF